MNAEQFERFKTEDRPIMEHLSLWLTVLNLRAEYKVLRGELSNDDCLELVDVMKDITANVQTLIFKSDDEDRREFLNDSRQTLVNIWERERYNQEND